MAVVLIGTLDTKGRELGFVRDLLQARKLETIVIDTGSQGPPSFEPDIAREEVFRRTGTSVEDLKDRGEAVTRAAKGVASVVYDLHRAGRVDGIFGLGGSAGTVIGSAAMRVLPFGVPKVMVSTLASGCRPARSWAVRISPCSTRCSTSPASTGSRRPPSRTRHTP